MEVFMGTILPFGFNFPPRGWALCNGQMMAISQQNALFALLGTFYGGDGVTTFGLPNLQGRMPIGMGTGPGLTTRVIGEYAGTENTTLTIANMPMHTHQATATVGVQISTVATSPATAPSSSNNYLGASGTGPGSASIWSSAESSPVPMAGVSGSVQVGMAGNSLPVEMMNPFLALNFSIALTGIFPTRN